ncbi:UNVERIFIED_CONTAM: hypothetical protein FKN15_061782 [Acipenser sinensis]
MACRNVLVTGCSSGIGLAVAVRLAKDELKRFRVVATMRDLDRRGGLEQAAGNALNNTLEIKEMDVRSEESIRECVNSIPQRQVDVLVVATMRDLDRRSGLEQAAGNALNNTLEIKEMDVRSEESIRECVSSIPQRQVDVLVNNAGVGMIGPLECQSIGSMQSLFDTNFFGLARVVKEVLPDMKRRQSGHIVVMSSVMGIQGLLFNDVYSASKFAVEGFCESLAVQAMKFNVKMSLIEPGPVITEFENKIYEDAANMDLSDTDEETAKIFKQIYLPYSKAIFTALGQTPQDIAEEHSEGNPRLHRLFKGVGEPWNSQAVHWGIPA